MIYRWKRALPESLTHIALDAHEVGHFHRQVLQRLSQVSDFQFAFPYDSLVRPPWVEHFFDLIFFVEFK